jgi:hypothetical protein
MIVNNELGWMCKETAVANLSYHPVMYLEELRKSTKTSVRIINVPAKIFLGF